LGNYIKKDFPQLPLSEVINVFPMSWNPIIKTEVDGPNGNAIELLLLKWFVTNGPTFVII